ncbi:MULTISPECIES: maltose/glucose-specific PTS transporter subunit IIBC [unclassified Streptomyces]|uniref:maltose/glucose-specific PTS transporter subunit IIBC n=1 Tax=unclassified Streptomyces TaxID=2593676 RepID=UPI002DD8F1C1|nr:MULTISPECIES: maltose/glucose-specific PTS transporter subunit IIBC [unclassified Streptomyces]WSA93482.1 maltose/glucose-specific PTS transporter subunit IIBC [Streptomyces sp. NBC_01795]WSB77851.1 maltose/glucose-specific PTS transporter subunit IIBC [Streptomyces sp. NBC_01775]WSS13901.1 maltose/glucose-specific PTS transporter subunit IIBC [Streptomyces sp. NBC_01186]WSS42715.1 maltose/glucose-specific PTS transporter subunit IIBC [Streptomyces sp. NBC_01187]
MNSGSRNSARIRQAKSSLWEFFQGLGKTFMLPVALLAFCGIMLGIGSSLSSDAVTDNLTFLKGEAFHLVFTWMANTGGVAFTFLPVLFAMAIPLGLAREDKGVAAFSGFVGFASMNLAVNFFLTAKDVDFEDKKAIAHYGIADVLGIQSIDTGLLGAVAVGIIVSLLHRRFRTQRMPDALAFFGGLRFVPIISALALSVVGLVIPLLWPTFNGWIKDIGEAIGHTGVFGPFFFGMGEVLLRPIGLHHVLVAMFRFTDVGGAGTVCGEHVSGALNMFYAQLNCDAPANSDVTSATHFLSQGKMAAYLGGLPGAALAMYHCARRAMRPEIKALLVSGVVACVVGGITEPLEFLFLFIAPWLYLIHAVLVGLGFLVAAVLGVFIGNTDGNVIDWLVFGILQGTTTKWYLVPVIAAVWFAVYYFLFRWAIRRFDLKTPGREDPEDGQEGDEQKGAGQKESASGGGEGAPGDADAAPDAPKRELVAGKYDPVAILEALGGPDNIRTLDNCITRLRMTVEDAERLDEARLKKLGAVGVVTLDAHTVQVVIGPQVQSVKDALATLVQVK